jgi:hypothetical protein
MRDQISLEQKAKFITILEHAVNNNKSSRLRGVIEKFRTNARISDIQKRFLLKLLNSKSGKVAVAFKTIK